MPWTQGTFHMMVSAGFGSPERVPVEGWLNSPFALDERLYTYDCRRKAWCITHLPTGYAVRFVLGPLSLAKRVADALAAAADWNFTDPAQSKSRARAVHQVQRQFPTGTFTESDRVTQAKRAFQYPEERAAQGIVTAEADETRSGSVPEGDRARSEGCAPTSSPSDQPQ